MTGPEAGGQAPVGWVTQHTGAHLRADREVAVLALRRNPRRAHLLVSNLLGKHWPVPATSVLAAAAELAGRVRAADPTAGLVVGFAETATGLGHGVAHALGARAYAHTTRRPLPPGASVVAFQEEHSHAVEQLLGVLDDTAWRDPAATLVLVDDELSTGRTSVNAIRVLQQRWPRERYVLASLLDVRSAADRADNVAQVAALGAELRTVSLVDGTVHLPTDLPEVAARLVAHHDRHDQHDSEPAASLPATPVDVTAWDLPVAAPLTGAHGWTPGDDSALRAAVSDLAHRLRPVLDEALDGTGAGDGVLVLGDEECLYPGQLLAAALCACTSSTTRSPALVVDADGYPLRTALRFASTDDPERTAYAYDVAPSGCPDRGPAPGFAHLVLVTDRPVAPHTRDGLVARLRAVAGRSVHVVVLRSLS